MSDEKRDELHRQTDEVYPELHLRLALETDASDVAEKYDTIYTISGNYVMAMDRGEPVAAKAATAAYAVFKAAVAALESAVRLRLDELDRPPN